MIDCTGGSVKEELQIVQIYELHLCFNEIKKQLFIPKKSASFKERSLLTNDLSIKCASDRFSNCED